MAEYNIATGTLGTIAAGDTIVCPHSGAMKSCILPPGTYKLQCWGSKGQMYNSYTPGYGGYTIGTLVLTANTTIYCYTGGYSTGSINAIGFNGGGSTNSYGGGGGGGTDIRLGTDSLYSRVLVAGGGGGSSYGNTLGGYGGGLTGGQGGNGSATGGYGGTQTSGGTNNTSGAFGTANNNTSNGGGGGGGWYGGSSGIGSSTDTAGGGGSGYVYTSATASNYPSGCLLNSSHYLTDAQTQAGNTSFPGVTGTAETGHNDHGYIRITVMSINNLDAYVNIGGTMKKAKSMYVNIGGTMKKVSGVYININGTMKKV